MQSKNQPQLFQEAIKEKPKIMQNGIKIDDLPKYSYEELIKSAEELPEGVSPEAREVNKEIKFF